MPNTRRPISILEKDLTPELRDAGKRASDIVNEKLAEYGWDNLRRGCMAFRLTDGSSDGVIYGDKQSAVKNQLHEQQCYYVFFRNLPQGADPLEMAIMLLFQRKAYDAGLRLSDPDDQFGGREAILTTNWRDSLVNILKNGGERR